MKNRGVYRRLIHWCCVNTKFLMVDKTACSQALIFSDFNGMCNGKKLLCCDDRHVVASVHRSHTS